MQAKKNIPDRQTKKSSAASSDAVPLKAVAPETTARVRAMAESMFGQDSERILAFANAKQRLAERVRAHLHSGSLELTLTDNCYTMISVRRHHADGKYIVRLHHMFCDAPSSVISALANYVENNDKRASRILGDYIDDNQSKVTKRKKPKVRKLTTRGDVHDLQEIFDQLNRTYFGGIVSAEITWGHRYQRRRRRTSIKMGSYSPSERLIRIHRSLDREFVPRYFVAWVVYHEMLHQMHPIRVTNGRRQLHPPEFLADEAKFAHYHEARQWQDAHLEYLLHY